MQSLMLEINNPDTVQTIAAAAYRQGATPEAYALELLEAALLAQQSFEEVVEPVARSFDESGMSEAELDELIVQARIAARAARSTPSD